MAKWLFHILALVWLLATTDGYAQMAAVAYSGGISRGDQASTSMPTIIGIVGTGYRGGAGRGDVVGASSVGMLNLSVSYRGGAGRGDSYSDSGTPVSLGFPVFSGGTGRGDRFAESASTIIGFVGTGYMGGAGRGDNYGASTITYLDIAVSYRGGIGRGDAFSISEAPVSLGLPVFLGGLGRGENYATSPAVLMGGCGVDAPSSTPSVCINTPLPSITHAVRGVTGISSSTGLPPGVTVTWLADTVKLGGTPTQSGVYNYQITLASICPVGDATGMITVLPGPTIEIFAPPGNCAGNMHAIVGGNELSYAWSTGAVTESIYVNTSGLYSLTVTDDVGCSNLAELDVSILPSPEVNISTVVHPTYGRSNGSAQAEYVGGIEPVDLIWSNGNYGSVLDQAPQGNYIVTATGSNGCSTTAEVLLLPVLRGIIRSSFSLLQGVPDATVMQTGDKIGEQITNSAGQYTFDPISSGSYFTLTPEKISGKLNGITVADANMIQRHIVLSDTILGPYDLIAADVSGNNTLSSLDAVLIIQCLLNNPVACNLWIASWRFVDAEHNFISPQQPWGFPEKIVLYPGVVRSGDGFDFTGIKVGDVLHAASNPIVLPPSLVIQAADVQIQSGTTFNVPIRAFGFNELAAFQFALDFDPALLTLEGVETPAGGLLKAENFGLWQAAGGEIRSAFSSPTATTLEEGAEFFTLRFTARQGDRWLSELLRLKNVDLPAESYGIDLTPRPLLLRFDRTTTANEVPSARYALTVSPNPAMDFTQVRFSLPVSSEASLRVLDTNGRLIQELTDEWSAGEHAIQIVLPGSGLYLIELFTPEWIGVVKVVCAGD